MASHLRVSETEAQSIISQVKSTTDPQKEMTGIVEIMSPRWKAEAVSALAKIVGG